MLVTLNKFIVPIGLAICLASPAWSADAPTPFTLVSSAFDAGRKMDPVYTCDGQNISPPLSWYGVPKGTKSFALILEDPDAPNPPFTHWLIWNISGTTTQLAEPVPITGQLPNGAFQGTNDLDKYGYSGPCPPSGKHRYFFKFYALDTVLKLDPGATRNALIAAMAKHILAGADLIGTYARKHS